METSKRNKIIISLVISLILTLIVTKTIFFAGIPKINSEKVRRIAKNTKDNLTIFKNTFAYKISSNKIDYSQTLGDSSAVEYKMIAIVPTRMVIPTVTGQISLTPTEALVEPTNTPTPTEIVLVKVSPTISIKPPTTAPTVKKKPTPTVKKPSPTLPPSNGSPVKITNPLDQPYYNPSLAYKCYTPEKFIEVYANDVTTANCYQSVQLEVEKNITSVSILGKSIQIHQKAYPYFKAVADELAKNSVAKAYDINTIGAYVFRCNVNASTSDRNDMCSEGCVLSTHAFGISVDINWDENCNGCSDYTMPMEIVDIFESYGFRWGGRYKSIFGSTIDPMHFEFLYDLCKDIN